jgi:hypothetical protein
MFMFKMLEMEGENLYLSGLRLQLALGPFGVDVLSVCCINYCVQCLPQVLGYLASSGPQAAHIAVLVVRPPA